MRLNDEVARPWLLPAVYERLRRGLGEFLAELRPAVSLFMSFTGIDYDRRPGRGHKLDQFIRQVQTILAQYEGNLIQLTFGDKGSYLYAAFGAPVAHEDDALRAASAALALRDLAGRLEFIDEARLGINQGRMRTGAYGSSTMRTYGVLGDATNLAARLMQAAGPTRSWPATQSTRPSAMPWSGRRCRNAGQGAQRADRHPQPVERPAATGAAVAVRGPGRDAAGRPRAGAGADCAEDGSGGAGRGQIVGITGGAGMGKSRLVAEAAAGR